MKEEVAPELMQQIKRHAPEDPPPAMSSDRKGAYRQAKLATWGTVPHMVGREDHQQCHKQEKSGSLCRSSARRQGRQVVRVTTKVISGEQEEVKKVLGEHTA